MSVITERAIRSNCFFFKEARIHFPRVCLDSVFFELLCFVFNVHFRFGEESQGSFFSGWVQLFGSAKTSIALFGLNTFLWLLWQMLQMLYDLNDQIYVCTVETLPIVLWWETVGLNLPLDSQCFLSLSVLNVILSFQRVVRCSYIKINLEKHCLCNTDIRSFFSLCCINRNWIHCAAVVCAQMCVGSV